ncbi:MAG: hypothetical protein H8D45_00540, partial [Bacteroidetes bacterium]|nr:hypothetical protein [Bacteroidota bacterium]
MLKSILISTVMLLFVTGVIFSQTDSPEQKSGLKNTVTTEKPIPQYLLDQLEMAQRTENIEEENRIMNILNSKYLDVTFYNSFLPYNAVVEQGEDEKTHNPPYNPDWLGTDIEVYAHSDNTTNVTNRTLDMKYCMDNGKLYIASCVNIPSWHGIRVFSSSNSGASWVYESGLSNNATYWTGLSMTVEQRADGIPDSVRVNIFYTESNYSGGSDARLGFWSFKPDGTAYHVYKIIGTPTSGYKFVWPSAYSNGNFQSSSTDIGCIVGEYNNAGTTCYQMRQFYMSNFSWIFSITSCNTGWNEFRPSAVYKNDPSGTDSVYIATERRFTTPATYKLRVLKTRYYGGITAAWNYLTITTGTTGYDHNPCLAIEDKLSPTRLVITYTQNNSSSSVYGYGRRSYSLYGGGGTRGGGSFGKCGSTGYNWGWWGLTIGALTLGNLPFLWGDRGLLNGGSATFPHLGGSNSLGGST